MCGDTSFNQTKIHGIIQKLQLLKVSDLEKVGLKMDQNYDSNTNLLFEARILMKLLLES